MSVTRNEFVFSVDFDDKAGTWIGVIYGLKYSVTASGHDPVECVECLWRYVERNYPK